MKVKVQSFFNLFLLGFFIAVIITSYGYNAKARLMPLVIAFPCVIMILFQLIQDLRGKKQKKAISIEDEMFLKTMEKVHVEVQAEEKKEKDSRKEMLGLLKSALWITGFVLMVYLFGFLITIPVYTIIFMRYSKDSWLLTLSTAAGLWVTIYVTFVLLAKIALYDGLVFTLLGE